SSPPAPLHSLPSFPTRRSSDLLHHRLDVLLHRPELFATMDEDDLLRGRHDLEGDLERAVSPADHDDALAFEFATVPHAVLYAVRLELRFARHTEPFRLEKPHPHREDDGPPLVRAPLAGRELEA